MPALHFPRWTLLLLVACAPSYGTTLTFSALVSSANLGSLVPGQTVQGSLSYDASSSALVQADGTLDYAGSITDFQLGGLHLTGALNQNVISILPFSASGYVDIFEAQIGTATSTLELYLSAFKNTGTLGNGALPVTAPSLAAFQDPAASPLTYVQLADYSSGYQHIDANLTSLSATTVPEPGTLALGGLSLTGFSLLFARRRPPVLFSPDQQGNEA